MVMTIFGAILMAYGIADLRPQPAVRELATGAAIFLCAAVYARITRG